MAQQFGKVRFKVHEGGDSSFVFIALEPVERTIDVLERGFFTLSLKAGTTFEAAQRLAATLNEAVERLTFMGTENPFVDTPDDDSDVRH